MEIQKNKIEPEDDSDFKVLIESGLDEYILQTFTELESRLKRRLTQEEMHSIGMSFMERAINDKLREDNESVK